MQATGHGKGFGFYFKVYWKLLKDFKVRGK